MRAKIEKYAERQNFDRAARTCDTHFEFIELDTKSLRKAKALCDLIIDNDDETIKEVTIYNDNEEAICQKSHFAIKFWFSKWITLY